MTMQREEAKVKLEAYFANQLGLDVASLGADEALFTNGRLDSMEAVNLISFLDSELHATIDPLNVGFEELDSVNKILDTCNY